MSTAATQGTRNVPAMGPQRWSAFTEVANGLGKSAPETEIQGSVIHRDPTLPLATACTLGCGATVLGVFLPQIGLVALLLLIGSVIIDAQGGRSIVRRLTPMSIGRTILVWPGGGSEIHDERPVTVIALDAGRPIGTAYKILFALTVCGFVAAIIGTAIHYSAPNLPLPTQRWGAVTLATGPVLAGILTPILRRSCGLRSANRVAHDLIEQFQAKPTAHSRIALAIVDQSPLHADGLTALLSCDRQRFRPGHTEVICWGRGDDSLAVATRLWRTGATSESALNRALMAHQQLPARKAVSAAHAVRRQGLPAIGLVGGPNPREVSQLIVDMARSLDNRKTR